MIDAFLLDNEIMRCVEYAAYEYQVPRTLLLAIIKTESNGNKSAVNLNRNGTKDVGVMQINTIWEHKLRKEWNVQNAGKLLKHNTCYNIRVGAWILRQELGVADHRFLSNAEFWKRVGNYHSKTPVHNKRYQGKVYKNLNRIVYANHLLKYYGNNKYR